MRSPGQGLDGEQGRGSPMDPVEGAQEHQQGMEMIAPFMEPQDGRVRGLKAAVMPNHLVEETEIEGGRFKMQMAK